MEIRLQPLRLSRQIEKEASGAEARSRARLNRHGSLFAKAVPLQNHIS